MDKAEVPEWMNQLSERVIGCAIEVQRELGSGLLEGIYEAAMAHELELAGIPFARQRSYFPNYKGITLPPQRLDLLVEETIVLELKAVEAVSDAHLAQLLTYMRLAEMPLGLLINFNAITIAKGTYCRINSRALRPQ